MPQTPVPPSRQARNADSGLLPSFQLRTLGCRLNQAESDEIHAALAEQGACSVDSAPDVVIVNTCTVTAEASKASRKLIRRSVADHPKAQIVVTGCYAVAAPEVVGAIPGVDLVVPNKDKDRLATRVASTMAGLATPRAIPSRIRANLKIQTGCDELCSFCIVPQTRGRLASRSADEVLSTARRLVEGGTREVILTGVHLGKYGWDRPGEMRLSDLIGELGAISDLRRIRLSSIEASQIDRRLLDALRSEPKICRHLHIPLQTGDEGVWRAMRRPGTLEHFREIVSAAKGLFDDLTLTTDVLVGYPGEGERAFARTEEVIVEVGFRRLHVFRFSPRSGTPAAEEPNRVDAETMRDRAGRLRRLGAKLKTPWLQEAVGKRVSVLIERAGPAADQGRGLPRLDGLTDNYLRVFTSGPAGHVGQTVEVLVTSAGKDSVEGDIVG